MSLKYTEEHEWIKVEGDLATVGITHHAQDALGDVVFVELPEVGSSFEQKAVAGVVESVKAAADVYMPISGEDYPLTDKQKKLMPWRMTWANTNLHRAQHSSIVTRNFPLRITKT